MSARHEIRSYRAELSSVLHEQKLVNFLITIIYSDITKRQYKVYTCVRCGSKFLTLSDAESHVQAHVEGLV